MKVYRVKNLTDNTYSNKSMYGWGTTGGTWVTIGRAKAHVTRGIKHNDRYSKSKNMFKGVPLDKIIIEECEFKVCETYNYKGVIKETTSILI